MPPTKKRSAGSDDDAGARERTGTRAKVSPTRILIVDDVLDNLDLYAEFFRFKGYDVVTAENGQRALELAASEAPIDVVIMDLALPVLDGFEATRRLKTDPRTSSIPVIVLTGHVEADHRKRAIAAGCDVFLTKPHLPRDLYDVVLKTLASKTR